tara:strand:+ start:2448 stop:2642 length:195 start_codon:yes stop_codon:yes gene_type:complete
LKGLQDFNLTFPKNSNILEILDNPEAFGERFAQNALEIQGSKILTAKKLGSSFAKSLLEEKNGI